jgi:Gram-negative bacterial TonB protein C-terminal
VDVRVLLAFLTSVVPSLVVAQSRSAQLLSAARAHIVAAQFDSADAELVEALDSAPYIMDSSWAYVWRGVLEYQLGHHQLARLSFRRALALYPAPVVPGIDSVSPGSAVLFDQELRGTRVYHASDLDQPARRLSGSALNYPAELRGRRISGDIVLRMIVDTLGRVSANDVDVLTTPDSGLVSPVAQMMAASHFSPARIGGKPVRSIVAFHLKISPTSPRNPVQLIDQARARIAAGRPDSAFAFLAAALDSVNGATPAVRVYAELVQGMAWSARHDSARAAAAIQLGLGHYRELLAQGVDFSPFLRSLADSLRLTARRE